MKPKQQEISKIANNFKVDFPDHGIVVINDNAYTYFAGLKLIDSDGYVVYCLSKGKNTTVTNDELYDLVYPNVSPLFQGKGIMKYEKIAECIKNLCKSLFPKNLVFVAVNAPKIKYNWAFRHARAGCRIDEFNLLIVLF